MQVQINDKIIQKMKDLFPDRLAASMTASDIDFFIVWFCELGLDVVGVLLRKRPYLTLGKLLSSYHPK